MRGSISVLCGVYLAAVFVLLFLLSSASPVTGRHHLFEAASSSPSSSNETERDVVIQFCAWNFCQKLQICYCCMSDNPEPVCYRTRDECKKRCPVCNPKCPPASSSQESQSMTHGLLVGTVVVNTTLHK